LRFVDMIVNKGLTAGTFSYLIMLLLPNFLTFALPISLFIAVLFTYNRLISDRELVIMRGAGQSQNELAFPALFAAGGVVVIGYILNLYLVPESYRLFREMQWEIRYSYSHVLLQEGTFNNITDKITVYIRERSKDGQLLGIMVHDARNPDKPITLMAEQGALVESDGKSKVVMQNGSQQSTGGKSKNLSILYFDRHTFDLETARTQEMVRFREPRERSLYELLNLDKAEYVSPKDVGKYTVEAHKRLSSPLYSLGYTLIALAFLISGGFTRRTLALRIILSAITALAVFLLDIALINISAKKLFMIPLIYLNAVIPIFFGYYYMVRLPKSRIQKTESPSATG
ncbi:MAG: LptF/LptG family permease, partial [Rhodospirillales bacterium]|nr:LptF/LptG family permease [Rhodospirillales bacterium]